MEIKEDKRNYRIHGDDNKALIRKSLEECGGGRSILIDADNEIIAGNGVYEQAKKLKIPVKVVETDGSELVVVKRTDLKTQDEKRKRLAVMDNSASDTSEFDLTLLKEDFEPDDLADMGIDDLEVEPEDMMLTEPEADIDAKKIKLVFTYKDSAAAIETFIREMNDNHPDLLFTVEVDD